MFNKNSKLKFLAPILCVTLSILLVITLSPNSGFVAQFEKMKNDFIAFQQEHQADATTQLRQAYTINFVSTEVELSKTSMVFNEGVASKLDAVSYNNSSLNFLAWSLKQNNNEYLIMDGAVIDESCQILAKTNNKESLIKLTDFADASFTINLFAKFEIIKKQETVVDTPTAEDVTEIDSWTMDKGPISEGQNWEDDYVDMPQTNDKLGSRVLGNQPIKSGIKNNNLEDETSPFSYYKLIWKRINDDPVEEGKTEIVDKPSSNVAQRFQYQVDFAFESGSHFEKESIEIVFDAQYWTDRTGIKVGTMSLGVPTYPSTSASFAYTYNAREKKYILTNTKAVEGNTTYSIQFSINDVIPQQIKDMSRIEFCLNFSANTNNQTYTQSTNTISATMDTSETLQGAFNNNGVIYKTWTQAKSNGCSYDKPENEDDYIYVSWYLYTKPQGCKNFSLELQAKLGSDYEGAYIFGAGEDGTYTQTFIKDSYVNSGFTVGQSIWVAFPKSIFETPRDQYSLKLDSSWTLTECYDTDDPDIVQEGTDNTISYTAPQSFKVFLNWEDDDNKEEKRPTQKSIVVQGKHYNDKFEKVIKLEADEFGNWEGELTELDGTFDYWVEENDINRDAYYYYTVSEKDEYSATIIGHYYTPGYDAPLTSQNYSYNTNFKDNKQNSKSDNELSKLANGQKVSGIIISSLLKTIAMQKTLGDNMEPGKPASYGQKEYKCIQGLDNFNLEGVGPLESDEYSISKFELNDNIYYAWVQEEGFMPNLIQVSPQSINPGQIIVWAQANGDEEAEIYATASWDLASGTYKFDMVKDGCVVSGKTITFPSDKKINNVYLETSTTCAGIDTSCNFTIDIIPNERIKDCIYDLLDQNLYGFSVLESSLNYGLYDQDGNKYFEHSATLDSYLHGYMPKLAPQLTTNIIQSDPDQERRLIPLKFQQKFVSQSNIENQADYLNFIKEGDLSDVSKGTNTWYTLVPKGVIVDIASVKVKSGDTLLSVEYLDNFRDSGKTMLICKTKNTLHLSTTSKLNPGVASIYGYVNTLQIEFDGTYSFTDTSIYSNNVVCNSAFESGCSWIGNVKNYIGEPDDPNVGNHIDSAKAINTNILKEIFTGLDDNHMSQDNNFVYSKTEFSIKADLYFEGSFAKESAVDGDSNYTQSNTIVHEGQGYNYKLAYTLLSSKEEDKPNACDLVIVDKLERKSKTDDNESAWKGYFNYINLNKLYELGISPVVYASTSEDIVPTSGLFELNDRQDYVDEYGRTEDDENFSGNFKLMPNWQKLEDIEDHKAITAIAVDATHKKINEDGTYEKGSQFRLENKQTISIDVHMIAPAGDQVPAGAYSGDGYEAELNGKTVNRSFINMKESSNEGIVIKKNEESITQFGPCITGIVKQDTNVKINFNDDNNRDGFRPETLTITVCDEHGAELAKIENLHVPENGVFDLVFNGLSSWREGKYGKYVITQQDASGKTILSDKYEFLAASIINPNDKTTTYVVEDKHEPEKISLYGNISWVDGDSQAERPNSFDLDLRDSTGNTIQTIKVNKPDDDNWTYEFFDVYKSENAGQQAKYTLLAKVDDYKPSYTEQQLEEDRYKIDFTNSYYPYGDLAIIQKEYLDAPSQAKVKSFEFSVEFKQGTQILAQPFDYEIFNATGESIETGKYSSGEKIDVPEGCNIIIKKIPSHATYSIYQYELSGFTQEDVINDQGELLSYDPSNAIYYNRYSSIINFSPTVIKYLKNHDIAKYQFKFQWLQVIDADTNKVLKTASNGQSEQSDENTWLAYVNFNPLKITNLDLDLATGNYNARYLFTETNDKLPGYTYDQDPHALDITFTDNGDGTISSSEDLDNPVCFTNIYKATGAYSPKAWVSFNSGNLVTNQFSFALSKLKQNEDENYIIDDGFSPIEKYNTKDGTINFMGQDDTAQAINLTEENIGKDYYYIINQTNMDNPNLYSYDKSIKGIKLSVIDNNDGTLSVETKDVVVEAAENNTYTIDESVDADMPVFYNTHIPGNLEIQNLWNQGSSTGPNEFIERDYHVVLSGDNLPDEFDYTIEPVDETPESEPVEESIKEESPKLNSNAVQSKNKNTDDNANTTNPVQDLACGISDRLQKFSDTINEVSTAIGNVLLAPLNNANDAILEEELDHIKCEFTIDEVDDNKGVLTFTAVSGEIVDTDTCWDATAARGGVTNPWISKVNNYYKSETKFSKIIINENCKNVSVTNGSNYFANKYIDNIDGLTFLNTSNCSDFLGFFGELQVDNLDLSNFITANATNMNSMFRNCNKLKSLDLTNFDTANVEDMIQMFMGCSQLENINISSFNTAKVTSMISMFNSCSKLENIDLSSFDTSNVVIFSSMFNECYNLKSIDISNFNTSKAIAMYEMFCKCYSLSEIDVSNFNTHIVTEFGYMFAYCVSLQKIDLSSFEFEDNPNIYYMFGGNSDQGEPNHLKYFDFSSYNGTSYHGEWESKLPELETLILSDTYVKSLVPQNVLNDKKNTLVGQNGTTNDKIKGSNWGFDLPGKPGLFWTKDYTVYDQTDKKDTLTFYGCDKSFDDIPNNDKCRFYATPANGGRTSDITDIKEVSFDSSFCSSYIKSCKEWFSNFTREDLTFDFTNFDTSTVTNMSSMFSYCNKLESLDVSSFKTFNVVDMSNMFNYCTKLQDLDLTNFDMRNVKNLNSMFWHCEELNNLNMSTWDLCSATDCYGLFFACFKLQSIDLSGKLKNNTTCLSVLCLQCFNLSYVDLSNNNIILGPNSTGITDNNSLFSSCSKLKNINLENTTISNPSLTVDSWFSDCASLEKIDISNFNFNIGSWFFYNCLSLQSITLGDTYDVSRDCNLPNPPVNDQYTGFWVKSDFSAKPNNPGSTAFLDLYNSDQSLYAGEWIWEPKVESPYTVKYDANGGSGSMVASKFTAGEIANLPECAFSKFNSEFAGWKDELKSETYTDGTIPANTYDEGDEVTLKAQWEPKSGGGTITGSEFDIKVPASGKAVLKDLPAGTAYQVYQKELNNYVLVSSSDTVGSIKITEIPDTLGASYNKTSSAKFYNRYSEIAPITTTVNLSGLVYLDNKLAQENMFAFTSDSVADNPIYNLSGGAINFGSITYNAPGEFTYTINQVPGTDSLIVYDDTIYTVTVNITEEKDEEDTVIALNSLITIFDGTKPCDKIAFKNEHKCGIINFENKVEKGSDVSDPDFTYEISFSGIVAADMTKVHYKIAETEYELSLTSAKAQFKLKKTQTAIFTDIPHDVKFEIIALDSPAGWIKTGETDTKGTIVGGTEYNCSMTYKYGVDATADIQAWVYLKGATVEEGQFAFDLLDNSEKSILPKDASGNPVYVTNEAPDDREEVDGIPNPNYLSAPISFANIIKISAPDDYEYTIKQIPKIGDGIVYDDISCKVTLTAEDRGDGTYIINYSLDYGSAEKTRFINKIDANGNLNFTSKIKEETGNVVANEYEISYHFDFLSDKGQQLNDNFTYKILKSDGSKKETGNIYSGDIIKLCHNQLISINLPVGVSYRVYSVEENKAFSVYSYDGITISNKISSQGTITEDAKQANGSCVQNYTASGYFEPTAVVSLLYGILQDKQFSFVITNLNSGNTQTVSNDATGLIPFEKLSFNGSQAGTKEEPFTYNFEIYQNTKKSETIQYDSQKYNVQVSVYDESANGTLKCDIIYKNNNDEIVSQAEFTNKLILNDLPETGMLGIIIASLIALIVLLFCIYKIFKTRRKKQEIVE